MHKPSCSSARVCVFKSLPAEWVFASVQGSFFLYNMVRKIDLQEILCAC